MKDINTTFKVVRDVIVADIGFHVLTSISILLIVVSFFIPPMGIIDSSVFIGVGELFGFAALWELHVAIRNGLDAKIEHRDTTLSLHGNHETEESEEDDNQKKNIL